jgi:hypothetical protein
LPAGIGNGVAFTPAGDAIAVAHNSTPYIAAYPWSGSGFGSKFANPAALPTNPGYNVSFSKDGNQIAIGHGGASPFVTVYPWSGSGFGTKYADPISAPPGGVLGVAWSTVGDPVLYQDYIAVTSGGSPFVTAYPWSASGFGTKYANPATLITNTGNSVAFSPSGDAIAVAHANSPYITAYPWAGSGFGTVFSNPGT